MWKFTVQSLSHCIIAATIMRSGFSRESETLKYVFEGILMPSLWFCMCLCNVCMHTQRNQQRADKEFLPCLFGEVNVRALNQLTWKVLSLVL